MSKQHPASIYTALRIPPDLRRQAAKEAGRQGRTLSNYIRYLIQRDLIKVGMIREESPAKQQHQILRVPVKYSDHLKQPKGRKARARKNRSAKDQPNILE